jgi:putative transcriptional regulator
MVNAMKRLIKKAIGDTIQGLVDLGIKTSFTEKELNSLGIKIKPIEITPKQIRAVRLQRNMSQAVFARVLNVSASSVRQWEQGQRTPTGATKVLLELLQRDPAILDYRLPRQ